MITYLFWGFVILFVLTILFYVVIFSLIYYWRETKITFVIVPLIFTFEFFLAGFLVVFLFSIFVYYISAY